MCVQQAVCKKYQDIEGGRSLCQELYLIPIRSVSLKEDDLFGASASYGEEKQSIVGRSLLDSSWSWPSHLPHLSAEFSIMKGPTDLDSNGFARFNA